jgi:CheY-like chemotaxis protein
MFGEALDTPPLDGVCILLVEDEATIAMCFEDALQDAGASVFTAATAPEAYRLLEQVRTFDLLITDLNLGRGGNGFEVARAARQRDRSIAVIYCSGDPQDARHALVAHSQFLTKPITLTRLVGAARQAVDLMREAVATQYQRDGDDAERRT